MMRKVEYLESAIWCKGMCESIICYDYGRTAKEYLERNQQYLGKYVEKLGEEVVLAILQDVIDNVLEIKEDVHTDSEGCTYNSITYKEGYMDERKLKDAMYDLWDKTVGYKG